ncbi:MAG: phosphoribosylformylglycinamidine cyclo-ligase [Planctomycetes bacterium]|nr:phosphoribosylformylglycinamidine cyclo-ligase [Planctomycetota bacterium]
MSSEDSLSYKDAGVDIAAQDEALARARGAIRKSFIPGVLGDVGLFGGLFDPAKAGFRDAILVATADGVGTKLEVARKADRWDTVGRDLVQHCINDVLVQGAQPLFFLDYVAMGSLEPEKVAQVISGCAAACSANGLALLGGETAEMPGVYRDGDVELAGFLVGAVRREELLDGSRVRAGQHLIGLKSSGLHTNGYSLARMILFERLGLELMATPDELGGQTVVDALLEVHRSYLQPLRPLIAAKRIAALAHITGGGLRDNMRRCLPAEVDAVVDRSTWEPPALFRWLVAAGGLADEEAYRAFNMGIGIVAFVEGDELEEVETSLCNCGEEPVRLGRTVSGSGHVRWAEKG